MVNIAAHICFLAACAICREISTRQILKLSFSSKISRTRQYFLVYTEKTCRTPSCFCRTRTFSLRRFWGGCFFLPNSVIIWSVDTRICRNRQFIAIQVELFPTVRLKIVVFSRFLPHASFFSRLRGNFSPSYG